MSRMPAFCTVGSVAALLAMLPPIASMSTQGEIVQPHAGCARPASRIASMAATTRPPPAESPAIVTPPGVTPLAAPIYADLRGLAPLLIQVGAAETLLDDAIRLAQVAGAADVAVDLQIWPEMIHVWHVYHPELAAGRRAIAAGGEFARAMTSRGSRSGF